MSENTVTRDLARWIIQHDPDSIPVSVRHQGVRTFVNWFGCAVGGASHPTVDRAWDAFRPFAGPSQATLLGRREKSDIWHAALVNGISSHVLDYDDTHLKTIIHPGGPVLAAALPAAELNGSSGRDLLDASIMGIEVCCRIGNSVYPDHYDRGWHITATAGVFGAAVAVGCLLNLNETQMAWALGLAATQASGLREMFGTMTKSLHPGQAARNGSVSAHLARAGFDSSEQGLEAPRGFANVLSTKQDYRELYNGLGHTWESALNAYKPFACGIVIHPVIDGCLQLRPEAANRLDEIVAVKIRANPLVLELTGKSEPRTGLEGKFSVYHAAAVSLVAGDGSPTAFTDAVVNDPDIVSLRRLVEVSTSPEVHEAAAQVKIVFQDGQELSINVDEAIGSLGRPMSDRQLNEKFLGQTSPVIGADNASHCLERCWELPELGELKDLLSAAVPGPLKPTMNRRRIVGGSNV